MSQIFVIIGYVFTVSKMPGKSGEEIDDETIKKSPGRGKYS